MMESILVLDTAAGTFNRGDDIIMECVWKELDFLTKRSFVLTLPTHVSPFHWYQVRRKSTALMTYANAKYKFAGGSNLMVKNLLTHYPQWNINLFNYQPLKGIIMMGIGAGAGDKSNRYTQYIYKHMLNRDFYHSMRDERSKEYVESLGLKALNTGCVTMWLFTPEFCKQIPKKKSDTVVFTITGADSRNQLLVDILRKQYSRVVFWPQGNLDYDAFKKLNNINGIEILPATKDAYDKFLTETETDYVGTRLHGGVYAMRHKRRAIILAIDERARGINEKNNLNCIEFDHLEQLEPMIESEFATEIKMDFDAIAKWRNQFI